VLEGKGNRIPELYRLTWLLLLQRNNVAGFGVAYVMRKVMVHVGMREVEMRQIIGGGR
jgi:hypothetical protein